MRFFRDGGSGVRLLIPRVVVAKGQRVEYQDMSTRGRASTETT